MEQLSETLIWGLFVFVAVFLVNFLWIFKRGYENIIEKLSALGADIKKIVEPDPDFLEKAL